MSPRDEMTFWEHLEELRRVFIKITVAIVGCGLVAFLLKDEVFRLILAPMPPIFCLIASANSSICCRKTK